MVSLKWIKKYYIIKSNDRNYHVFLASKEPKPIRTVLPPTQNKPRKYSEEPRTSEPNPPGPHRPVS